jgi:hypothetical protein
MILALRSPTLTYHLAPTLAAGAWPVVARVRSGRASVGAGVRAGAGGLLVAGGATLALWQMEALRGPVLIGGTAPIEAAIAAVVGATWGAWVLTRARAGLVVRALDTGVPSGAG